jgi:hypothetical protein
MRYRLFGAVVLAAGVVTARPASAEMPGNEMIALFRKGDQREAVEFYLRGLFAGYSWANTVLWSEGKTPLFCEPEKIVLTVDQELDILARHIEHVPANGKVPVGLAMLHALRDAFPCTAK